MTMGVSVLPILSFLTIIYFKPATRYLWAALPFACRTTNDGAGHLHNLITKRAALHVKACSKRSLMLGLYKRSLLVNPELSNLAQHSIALSIFWRTCVANHIAFAEGCDCCLERHSSLVPTHTDGWYRLYCHFCLLCYKVWSGC